MALTQYKKKRNFKNTPEPGAKKVKASKQLVFVVQRHDASHLHYDFRLEMEGVLKSWAVPKGPSMNPDDKRLAMMVEDHPFEYRNFAGVIPEGNYGAGDVEIWDEGTYTPYREIKTSLPDEKELLKELKAGDLKFTLNGKHLKGSFALVKIRNTKYGKKDNAWLLIKKHDNHSVDDTYTSEDYKSLHGVKPHGKKKAPEKVKQQSKEKPEPEDEPKPTKRWHGPREAGRQHVANYIKPMLAKLTDKAFDDNDWLFEIKWDGYRAIAETDGKNLKFYSRNGISFLTMYPEVVDELKKIKQHLVLDGEVVAMDENGVPSFQLLQNYEEDARSLAYYVFDILRKDKKDLTSLPLTERKAILKKAIPDNDFIRYSDHIIGEGKKFFALSSKRNLEGVMAKKADSTYTIGARTGNWLKIKNHKGQEAVIAGFTAPRNTRKHFGALVLGIYKGKKLVYCGHTGTGFNESSLSDLYKQLIKLKQKDSPFEERVVTNQPVTWVKPVLVCNIKFSEITKDGIMRHPVFLGLREDKKAKEVVNENKRDVPMKTKAKSAKHKVKTKAVKKSGVKGKVKATKEKVKTVKGEDDPTTGDETKIDGHIIKLTNQNKVYFPKDKITKGDIVEYYQSIADYILPYLKNRPQSLYRNPNGIVGPGFFQKDMGTDAPDWAITEKIYSESNNKDVNYLICNDKATLAYMNNLGCIELNTWHSRVGSLENPDYIAIDLDPSPKNTFGQVIETAQAVKEVFDSLKIDSYSKTSGATGIHIYVPLQAKYTYDQVKNFVNIIAMRASELVPDFTSLVRPLKARGNKIYIDYLQNRQGQTLASVYSVRPKTGATVSTPLEWNEVKKGLTPQDFTIKNIKARLKSKGDLFKPILGKGANLKDALKKLEQK